MRSSQSGQKKWRYGRGIVVLSVLLLLGRAVSAESIYPAKLSVADLAGAAFDWPETVVTQQGDAQILDLTSLKSSDGKFASGMYKAGPQIFDITEPYGVDEFMFFLEGSVTLTSADGSVTTVNAGEAVTIPKEWTGRWETEGYRKIWVIYSVDGEGL
jgi:uncharacterized cupin superfamily protein